jgi:hypothetical protein
LEADAGRFTAGAEGQNFALNLKGNLFLYGFGEYHFRTADPEQSAETLRNRRPVGFHGLMLSEIEWFHAISPICRIVKPVWEYQPGWKS